MKARVICMPKLFLFVLLTLLFNNCYAQKEELKRIRRSSEITYLSFSNGIKTYYYGRDVYRPDGSIAQKWDFAPSTERRHMKDSIEERIDFKDSVTFAGRESKGYLITTGAADTLRSITIYHPDSGSYRNRETTKYLRRGMTRVSEASLKEHGIPYPWYDTLTIYSWVKTDDKERIIESGSRSKNCIRALLLVYGENTAREQDEYYCEREEMKRRAYFYLYDSAGTTIYWQSSESPPDGNKYAVTIERKDGKGRLSETIYADYNGPLKELSRSEADSLIQVHELRKKGMPYDLLEEKTIREYYVSWKLYKYDRKGYLKKEEHWHNFRYNTLNFVGITGPGKKLISTVRYRNKYW